jgi:DNA adenine methylase
MSNMKRPMALHHGGKFKLRHWVIEHFPAHRVYIEPFGGMASVLLEKERADLEVLNDLDHQIVNLYRVMRDPVASTRLADELRLTPYAREEFDAAYAVCSDPVEMARRYLVRAFMGFGANSATCPYKNGFRSKRPDFKSPAYEFAAYPPHVEYFRERLAGVTIECKPALDVVERYDEPDALIYVDPPYMPETRIASQTMSYRHEMTVVDHEILARTLRQAQGMVVLSGYRCDAYDEWFRGWTRVDRDCWAERAARRTESLWISPRCEERLRREAEIRDANILPLMRAVN